MAALLYKVQLGDFSQKIQVLSGLNTRGGREAKMGLKGTFRKSGKWKVQRRERQGGDKEAAHLRRLFRGDEASLRKAISHVDFALS